MKDGKRKTKVSPSGMATAMTGGGATQTREHILWTLTDQLICLHRSDQTDIHAPVKPVDEIERKFVQLYW